MSDIDFTKLRSTDALVCRRHVAGEMGGATVWCVCLADGFLIECGFDGGLGNDECWAIMLDYQSESEVIIRWNKGFWNGLVSTDDDDGFSMINPVSGFRPRGA